jgi:hypothetical protein
MAAQNMKTGADALGNAEKESWHANLENRTRRPYYRRKLVRGHKTLKRESTPTIPPKMIPGAQNMTSGAQNMT